jgi:hypothetical protein
MLASDLARRNAHAQQNRKDDLPIRDRIEIPQGEQK